MSWWKPLFLLSEFPDGPSTSQGGPRARPSLWRDSLGEHPGQGRECVRGWHRQDQEWCHHGHCQWSLQGKSRDTTMVRSFYYDVFHVQVEDFEDLVLTSQNVRGKLQDLGCFSNVGIHIDTSNTGHKDYTVTYQVGPPVNMEILSLQFFLRWKKWRDIQDPSTPWLETMREVWWREWNFPIYLVEVRNCRQSTPMGQGRAAVLTFQCWSLWEENWRQTWREIFTNQLENILSPGSRNWTEASWQICLLNLLLQ